MRGPSKQEWGRDPVMIAVGVYGPDQRFLCAVCASKVTKAARSWEMSRNANWEKIAV